MGPQPILRAKKSHTFLRPFTVLTGNTRFLIQKSTNFQTLKEKEEKKNTKAFKSKNFRLRNILPSQKKDTPRATEKMEQPKPATEQATRASGQETDTKLDPKEAGHASNGDGKWTSLVIGSESQNESQSEEQTQTQAQTQTEPSTTRVASPSLRKSVSWSPELVTEPPAMSYPSGSSPYVSSSPVPSSSFSFKGKVFSVSIRICIRTSFGIDGISV